MFCNILERPTALWSVQKRSGASPSVRKLSKPILLNPLLGYNRLPGFQTIKNNDVVVFNFPVDTLREHIPFDKKMNYVKRCIGIAGDSLMIKNKDIYINGVKQIEANIEPQFQYSILFKNDKVDKDRQDWLCQSLINTGVEGYLVIRGQLLKLTEKRKIERRGLPLRRIDGMIVFITEKEKKQFREHSV